MDKAVKRRLHSIQFGAVQTYKNIAIVPLVARSDGAFQYRTLGEALANWDIAITEISAAGSVTELMVVNRGSMPVLLVDGEELAGAKRNRALNSSILINAVSETRIPVVSTEQGRWSYTSKALSESGNVLAYKSRASKSLSVQLSLASRGVPRSDQNKIWADIATLQVKAGAPSASSTLSDVFKAREEDLRQCSRIFTPLPNQVGLVAFIGGRLASLEAVSLASAYARLHRKLVRSYALEALLVAAKADGVGTPATAAKPLSASGEGRGEVALSRSTLNPQPSTDSPSPVAAKSAPRTLGQSGSNHSELARAFLAELSSAEERQFPSVGHGTDCRYIGKALTGYALVHENEVIHAAFFRLDHPPTVDPQPSTNLASYRQRRRYRQ